MNSRMSSLMATVALLIGLPIETIHAQEARDAITGRITDPNRRRCSRSHCGRHE